MTTLIVFDIDGTLMHSISAHQQAFHQALRRSGHHLIDTDWGAYAHHTDSWIFREIFRRNRHRLPDESETAAFDTHLRDSFREITSREPVQPVAGAEEFVRRLLDTPGHCLAFATGGLRAVTMEKLARFGVWPATGLLVTASDHTYREHIVHEAIHRAQADFGGVAFDRVISIGDGTWDVRAAVALGCEFVGVGAATHALGDWFPDSHRISSFQELDLLPDRRLDPPLGAVPPVPAGEPFTAGPARCACWN